MLEVGSKSNHLKLAKTMEEKMEDENFDLER
jgi:hypothetical protein